MTDYSVYLELHGELVRETTYEVGRENLCAMSNFEVCGKTYVFINIKSTFGFCMGERQRGRDGEHFTVLEILLYQENQNVET